MKKAVVFLFLMCFSTTVLAQSYDALWKQYRQYADKDQPKSALTVLEQIKAKAEKEKNYGNLMAVLLREVNHQEEISTDSGKVFRERLDQRMMASGDGVMKTLYRIAKGDRIDIDSLLHSPDSLTYRQKDASLQWLPFFEKGKDSRIFNNDLLHVILLSRYSDNKLDSIYGPDNEYVRYNRIHNEQVRTEPYFTASIAKRTVSSATDIFVRFSHIRNLKALECEVSRVGTKERRTFSLTLPAHEPTKVFSDSLRIGPLPLGRWVVRITDSEHKTRSQQDTVTVSDTRLLQLSLPQKQKRYVFVNAITGEETTPDSSLIDRRYRWNDYIYNSNKGYKQYTDIYTDRAIYRPGQKIEAAIIRSSVTDGIETGVVAGEKLQVKLLDSKGEAVAEKYAVTDAYGTAAVDFTLPDGDIRSGFWRLATKGADASFRVEEYKRPTFEVKLKKNKDEYAVGDTAIITGTAMTYTGLPLQNCRVIASYNNNTDTLFTDITGHFQITVNWTPSSARLSSAKKQYTVNWTPSSARLSSAKKLYTVNYIRRIKVSAFVSALTGETQSAQCYLYVRPNHQPETPDEPKAEKPKDTTLYHIYYNVFAGNKVLESSKTYADTASFKNSFTYKEEYGDGAMVCFAWCKDDEIHYDNLVLRRPLPSNKLQIEWGTFRDHLAPGSKETWTLKILPEEANCQLSIVNYQLTAVLYDSSLDGIRKHYWQTHDRRHLAIPSSSWFTPNFGGLWIHGSAKDWVNWRNFDFTHINGECMINPHYGIFDCVESSPRLLMANGTSNAKAMRLGAALPKATESLAMVQDEGAAESMPVRSNFGETAFFYPQVETNDKGEATLEFTLPESLTSWRFIGIAHDKAMRMGIIDTTVVAQKQLMVQPNMPRFLRVGDKATITANVTNLSDHALTATVTLSLQPSDFRPQNSELRPQTSDLRPQTSHITINSGETVPVSFPVEAGVDTASLVCSIVAKSDDFTDGEQHEIPVLPAVQKLPEVISVYKSPHDLMMEDLPALSIPASNNAITLSNALYANVLTAALKDTLASPANDNILVQLINLQHSDGSFSWYPGMSGNKYITMAVLKTLVRMEKIALKLSTRPGGNSKQSTGLRARSPEHPRSARNCKLIKSTAFDFMQKAMDKEVSDMKKYKTTWLSNTALDWLYALSIDPEAKGRKSDAYKYLLRLLEDETNKSDMATKSVAAIVMENSHKEKEAHTFIESIKQHTVYREDMGRYFDSYRTNYSWCDYRIPSHTMAIEALHAITPEDNCTIAQMQRWLVSAKRTQKWDNPVNTVNAVNAFQLPVAPCPEETEKMYHQPTPEELENIIKIKREIITSPQPSALSKLSARPGGTLSSERTVNCKLSTKVKVRLTLIADRDYDFVSVTDHRPACLEPVNQLSGYYWGYYSQMKDDRTEYFFDQLSKGTHIIETEYYVTRPGTYTTGPATAVCTYAPAYQGTTPAVTLTVK